MKNKYENKREIIHRLLDGDLDPDEKQALNERVHADPSLEKEFQDLSGTLRVIEASERIPAPPFFTAGVMRSLPAGKAETIGDRIRHFLFRSRVVRWNMAAALIAVLFLVVIAGRVLRIPQTVQPITVSSSTPEQAVTVTVTMNLAAPEAHHVAVAGTFNKWDNDSHLLTKQENGIWTISIPLKPGEYSYMFIVDGQAWVTDPDAESYRDDGFGNKNAVVRVKI